MNKKETAQLLDTAAKNARAIEQISTTQTFSEEDAYEIQRLSIAERYKRGEQPVGLKLGFTSFAKMKQMGVHDMIWGRLTGAMWYKKDDELDLANFVHPRAEPEIAFLLKEDINREISLEEIPEYILACAPAIEIIDSRYRDFKFSLEDVIADNCSSSAFVIGTWQPLPETLNNLHMELKFDREVIHEGNSNAILDNPYLSICNASRLAAKYNEAFKKGNVLLAGAATPAAFIKPNSKIMVRVEKLGSCSIPVK